MRSPPAASPHPSLSFGAFVAMVAAMMALNAVAIDTMLPALPAIGAALHVASANERQWVITAYMLGFGVAQIVYGTVSDRFGRRPILLIGLTIYVLFSLLCAVTTDFTVLIVSRALQGVGSAASRVIAVSLVRDCYSGRRMARVMSLAFIVFLLTPVLAPALGQLVLLIGQWRWIFALLGLFGVIVLVWTALSLPETLPPERRRAIDPSAVLLSWRMVATDRMSVGYTIALTLLSGALFGFINSVQQIMSEVFAAPTALPIVFAAIGGSMAVGSLINSRIVERVGMRRVSHGALFGFLFFSAAHLFVAGNGWETLASFTVFQVGCMFCFALCGANFGAMAMEDVGSVAGAAASLQGFASTIGGALIGFAIGQRFDGTTVPETMGFILLGLSAAVAVFVAERGRLMVAQTAP